VADYFVVSHHHGLLPLAQRLRSEGHDVKVVIRRRRFERAWGERLDPVLSNAKDELSLDRLHEALCKTQPGTIVLSDVEPGSSVHQVLKSFPQVVSYLKEDLDPSGDPPFDLRAGYWFDGEKLSEPHLLIYDVGVWPGGLGPQLPGGLTLVMPDERTDLAFLEDLVSPFEDQLKAASFRGLVNLGLGRDPMTGGLRLTQLRAGWPMLHLEAWLSSTERVGRVLSGEAPPRPTAKYTVVLPVSIPPWPNPQGSAEVTRIGGLPPQLQGWNFWFDMAPNEERQELWTAGLDGLVCVTRGEGQSFETARMHAVGIAQQIQLPEKQFRGDVGLKVPVTLARLEQLFGLVL
jgi:hypothetical protein